MKIAAASLSFALSACASPCDAMDPACPLALRSLDAARAALPEPSDAGAFEFVADGYDSMVPRLALNGRARVVVTAGRFDGQPAWHVVQETTERNGVVSRTAWLSRDLRVLASELTDGDLRESARAGAHGTVVARTVAGETELIAMPGRLDGLGTLAGALLFFRGCPAERAAYGEPPWCPTIWRVGEDGGMSCAIPTKRGASAWIELKGPGRRPTYVDRSAADVECGVLAARAADGR